MEPVGDRTSVLNLESVVVRKRVIAGQREIASKIAIRLWNTLLAQQLSSCLSDIGERQGLLLPERFLKRKIPLVRTRLFQVWSKTDGALVRGLGGQRWQIHRRIRQGHRNSIEKI